MSIRITAGIDHSRRPAVRRSTSRSASTSDACTTIVSRARAPRSRSPALGALLCFDQHNIRYTTSTVIGEWARDKLTRYSLLTGNGDPYIWDFGSAAKHHRLHAPWLHHDHCRAGLLGLRGATGGDTTLFREAAQEIKAILDAEGRRRHAARPRRGRAAHAVRAAEAGDRGARRPAGAAAGARGEEHRRAHAAQHGVRDGRRRVPGHRGGAEAGVRESEIVALATKRLYEMGSDCVEAINSISGERCSPHPHNFTDRLIRPATRRSSTSSSRSWVTARATTARSTWASRRPPQVTAYRKAREWMDRAIELLKPGVSSDRIARAFPEAKEIGFSSEMEAFGLNFCHGLGLGLHERPLISRLNSLKDPIELKAGMVFAVETYCPASDGFSAARIEEEVILAPDGPKIISLYPAQELPIANPY
jgi:Xaa-Pro dipeptidase